MKKFLFLFAAVVVMSVSAFAQATSAVCFQNDGPCVVHIALYAECATCPGGPYVAPNYLRGDIHIPPSTSCICYSDYQDFIMNTISGSWASGATLPPPTEPSFHWSFAQLQYEDCDPIGGCGVQVSATMSPVSSSCMTATFTLGPTGDLTIHNW